MRECTLSKVLFLRHIPQNEVRQVLTDGKVNERKSNLAELPCPKYVVDAKVGKRGKNVQVCP